MKMTADERIQVIGQSISNLHYKVDAIEKMCETLESRMNILDDGINTIFLALKDIETAIEATPYIER